jgi:hypothetical protein
MTTPTLNDISKPAPNRRARRDAKSNKSRRYERFVQDPDHDIVQGAEAIARVINASMKFVYEHADELGLTKIGTRLFGSRKKLLEKVGGA